MATMELQVEVKAAATVRCTHDYNVYHRRLDTGVPEASARWQNFCMSSHVHTGA